MPLYIELVLALQYELLNCTLSGPLMIMIFRDSSNIGVPKYPSDVSKLYKRVQFHCAAYQRICCEEPMVQCSRCKKW